MNDFKPTFRFKEFAVSDGRCGQKVSTDGVIVGAWAVCPRSDGAILDVGAGCGLISFMLACRYPKARITGVEINTEAFDDFTENLSNFSNSERIEAIKGNYKETAGHYDLIVSNPPFFTNGIPAPDASRNLARHAGELSPSALLPFAARMLAPGGRLAFIAPAELHDDLEFDAALTRLCVARCDAVITSPRRGVTRHLWELGRSADGIPAPKYSTITVGDERYIELTRRFYLQY